MPHYQLHYKSISDIIYDWECLEDGCLEQAHERACYHQFSRLLVLVKVQQTFVQSFYNMIIGGQHVVEAIRKVMNDRNFATQEDIKAYCSYHKIVVVWSLDTQKICTCQKC